MAVSPTKPEKETVQEKEFKRKERMEETLSTKIGEAQKIISDPETFAQLQKDPRAKASLILAMKEGVDKEYHKDIEDTLNAFFPHPDEQKLPAIFKNTASEYRRKTSEYMKLSTGEKAVDPEQLQTLEAEINSMAEGLNQLSVNMGSSMKFPFFEDTDGDPLTPSVAISPEKKELLEQTRYVGAETGAKTVGTQPTSLITYRERKAQLQQTPGMTEDQLKNQLLKEIREGKVQRP